MNHGVPEGWARVSVGDVIVDLKYGTARKCGLEARGVPVLRIPNIANGKVDHSDLKYAELPAAEFASLSLVPGDVLVIRSNGSVSLVGQSAMVRDSERGFAFAGYLIRLRPSDAIMPEFLQSCLGGVEIRSQIELEARSTSGVNNINAKEILALPLSLPPLAEQQRIVAATEALNDNVRSSRERLDKIPAIIKRFQQAVLAAACDGRLTTDWRGTKSAVRPEVSLGEITSDIRTGPFGSALHKADYVSGGIPVINPMNLVVGKIVASPNVSITASTFNRLTEYALREGDVIIARRGEMGRCALVGPTEAGWLCGTGCAILRLKPEARPAFVELVISSPVTRAFLGEASVGTTMENLNQKALRSMPIFLPELAEQDEIVQRVRSLYRFADRLEARLKKAKAVLEKVPQSILAKAFRGELVPTEAELARSQGREFESAATMLDRIKSAQAKPIERQQVKRQAPPPKRSRTKALT